MLERFFSLKENVLSIFFGNEVVTEIVLIESNKGAAASNFNKRSFKAAVQNSNESEKCFL